MLEKRTIQPQIGMEIPESFVVPRKVPELLENAVPFVTWKLLEIQTGIFH